MCYIFSLKLNLSIWVVVGKWKLFWFFECWLLRLEKPNVLLRVAGFFCRLVYNGFGHEKLRVWNTIFQCLNLIIFCFINFLFYWIKQFFMCVVVISGFWVKINLSYLKSIRYNCQNPPQLSNLKLFLNSRFLFLVSIFLKSFFIPIFNPTLWKTIRYYSKSPTTQISLFLVWRIILFTFLRCNIQIHRIFQIFSRQLLNLSV